MKIEVNIKNQTIDFISSDGRISLTKNITGKVFFKRLCKIGEISNA